MTSFCLGISESLCCALHIDKFLSHVRIYMYFSYTHTSTHVRFMPSYLLTAVSQTLLHWPVSIQRQNAYEYR